MTFLIPNSEVEMNRRTKSPKLALARIERILGETSTKRTTIKRLAFLADLARRMKRNEVPGLVRWTGRTPTRGVKGWQAEALDWLRLREEA